MAILEALPLGADAVRDRDAAPSNMTIAVGCECHPSFFSLAPKESPGVPLSTRKAGDAGGPPSPVRAMTI
jgi:hypothetical protein